MAADLQRLIALCQAYAPSFEICLKSEWGTSSSKNHRSEIRKSISKHFQKASTPESSILDLSRPPRLLSHSVSISHSLSLGGWAATQRPQRVGFDIEITSRIKKSAVARICKADEINSCPDFHRLWGAKESLFKALEDQQPKVLSQLTIDQWMEVEPLLYRFQSPTHPTAMGFSLSKDDIIYSICLL